MLVEENPAHRIYWGDTHGHSGQAGGIGTVDSFLAFARDDARLDFVAHTADDSRLDGAGWERSRQAVQAFDEPGRFVPYLGWEWTRPARFGGHHSVLLRAADGGERGVGAGAPDPLRAVPGPCTRATTRPTCWSSRTPTSRATTGSPTRGSSR